MRCAGLYHGVAGGRAHSRQGIETGQAAMQVMPILGVGATVPAANPALKLMLAGAGVKARGCEDPQHAGPAANPLRRADLLGKNWCACPRVRHPRCTRSYGPDRNAISWSATNAPAVSDPAGIDGTEPPRASTCASSTSRAEGKMAAGGETRHLSARGRRALNPCAMIRIWKISEGTAKKKYCAVNFLLTGESRRQDTDAISGTFRSRGHVHHPATAIASAFGNSSILYWKHPAVGISAVVGIPRYNPAPRRSRRGIRAAGRAFCAEANALAGEIQDFRQVATRRGHEYRVVQFAGRLGPMDRYGAS